MLETSPPKDLQAHWQPDPSAELYDWRWMIRALLERLWLVVLMALLCAAAGATYVMLRQSHYTASTVLHITNLRLTASGEDAFFTESQFDPTFLETQRETIGSTPVLLQVIETLELSPGEPDAARTQQALRALRGALSIQRLGQSNLVEIGFTSTDRERAALVANAVAKAYMAKLESDRTQAVQTASGWLRARLQEAGPKAQVMSPAMPPIDKSDTRGMLIIALAGIVGAAAGGVGALSLAFLDRRIRSPRQLGMAIDRECFGVLPELNLNGSQTQGLNALLPDPIRDPQSAEWQVMRLTAVSMTRGLMIHSIRSVGITAPAAGEGATVTAASLAFHVAALGKKVLLVDAQVYDPELTRRLAAGAPSGLVDFLADRDSDIARFVVRDALPGVDALPLGKPSQTVPMLWNDGMARFAEATGAYDLVIFDLPPLDATADLRAAADYVDSFLLVVRILRSTDESVTSALATVPGVWARLGGTILNRVSRSRYLRRSSSRRS